MLYHALRALYFFRCAYGSVLNLSVYASSLVSSILVFAVVLSCDSRVERDRRRCSNAVKLTASMCVTVL
jgi:hypothetical protein